MARTRVLVAKFPSTCTACQCKVTPGQSIVWNQDTKHVQHLLQIDCTTALAAKAAQVSPAVKVNIDGTLIADFLRAAQSRGLQHPKVRFLGPSNSEVRIYIAGSRSNAPGAVVVLDAQKSYLGRIMPSGDVQGNLKFDRALLSCLDSIAKDPAAAAKQYAAVMGLCSFCHKPLTDQGSIEVGYGPVCAKHYGLPHRSKGTLTIGPVSGDNAARYDGIGPAGYPHINTKLLS